MNDQFEEVAAQKALSDHIVDEKEIMARLQSFKIRVTVPSRKPS
ncbi:MAG TPA: hypothetical protein VH186_17530 [Chloroflexia bacterium]|nr:hypothetical protein [Chloroflexia bacterium]